MKRLVYICRQFSVEFLKTLTESIDRERDPREWNLNEVYPCDKDVWRSSMRSAMGAANQLPGREPTDMDDAPTPER